LEYRYSVRQASVFSIVLLLAIGQNTALLCKAWCHPGNAAMAECAGQANSGTTLIVTRDNSCGRMAVSVTTLIREDLRRVSDQDARYVVVVSGYQAPISPGEVCHAFHPDRASPVEAGSSVLPLRI